MCHSIEVDTSPVLKKNWSPDPTALLAFSGPCQIMLPPVEASKIAKCVIVPQLDVAVGNVIVELFAAVVVPPDVAARVKFIWRRT
jgi:hypothetical protein